MLQIFNQKPVAENKFWSTEWEEQKFSSWWDNIASFLSLSLVLFGHPSTYDLRTTKNHLLIFRWVCLCQITVWCLHRKKGDFKGKIIGTTFYFRWWSELQVSILDLQFCLWAGKESLWDRLQTCVALFNWMLQDLWDGAHIALLALSICLFLLLEVIHLEHSFPSSLALNPHIYDNLLLNFDKDHHGARYHYSTGIESSEVCLKC